MKSIFGDKVGEGGNGASPIQLYMMVMRGFFLSSDDPSPGGLTSEGDFG